MSDTPIRFERWKPTARDRTIGYSYLVPTGHRGGVRKASPGRNRWDIAKAHIAASALYSGVEEFKVWGGIGAHRWQRTVLVSQEAAEAFLLERIAAGAFTLRSTLEQALRRRDQRLARTTDSTTPREEGASS